MIEGGKIESIFNFLSSTPTFHLLSSIFVSLRIFLMPKQILIVEDDEAIAEVAKISLEDRGYQVKTTTTITESREAISRKTPDIVFLDLWLGKEDGEKLALEIKKNHPDLPVILFSAGSNVEQAVKRTGAAGFIAKPFDLDDLTRMVEKYTGE
jgi:DNA-binding NtrC family response regulator